MYEETETYSAVSENEFKAGKVAKALLLGQTCDNCKHRQTHEGFSLCWVNRKLEIVAQRALATYRIPYNKTCEEWAKITK